MKIRLFIDAVSVVDVVFVQLKWEDILEAAMPLICIRKLLGLILGSVTSYFVILWGFLQ
jgi:hypothetical protein